MTATIRFRRCVQDSQEYGSTDEYMVSRLFFDIEAAGKVIGSAHADLKQSVGDDFERGAIEVGRPQGYDGPWNHGSFSDAAVTYFRGLVGSSGKGIRIEGSTDIRMRDNVFAFEREFPIELPERGGAGW